MNTPNPSKSSPCPGCLRFAEPGCPLRPPEEGRGPAVPRRVLLSQAAAAILPPALGFAAGFGFTGRFFPLSGEGLRAAVGTASMFLLALGVYLFRRDTEPKQRNRCN